MTVAEMIATGTSAGVRAESRKKTATSKWAGNPEGMTIMRRMRNPAGTSAVKKARSLRKEERRRKERIGRDGNARNEKGRV